MHIFFSLLGLLVYILACFVLMGRKVLILIHSAIFKEILIGYHDIMNYCMLAPCSQFSLDMSMLSGHL